MINATMLIAIKVMLSKTIVIIHMIALLGVEVATLSVLTAVVFQLIAPQTDAGEYDCTHNDRFDAVSRAPHSRRKHVLADVDSMRRGRSRQKHDYANDVSRGRRGNYTRSDNNTADRRLYRDASPNVDAGDTTCYARVDRASGRAAENVRADRPKRDRRRDKKHNISVHRRLRFDDSCYELDDDDDDDLYANNVDRCVVLRTAPAFSVFTSSIIDQGGRSLGSHPV